MSVRKTFNVLLAPLLILVLSSLEIQSSSVVRKGSSHIMVLWFLIPYTLACGIHPLG
jgi:hypothetical protein